MDVSTHLGKAFKSLDSTFTELNISDEELSPSPLLPSIGKKSLGTKEIRSRVHIGERSKSVTTRSSPYPRNMSVSKKNVLDFCFENSQKVKKLDDFADLMSLQRTLKQGLVDQDKILNLDIDGYYNKILHKQNAKELAIKDIMKVF